jgi:hypothetical protein
MKITIEVPDEQGPALIEWLVGIKKPSTTAKQEVSIVISTEVTRYKPKRTSWLDTNALRIPLLSITHDYVRQFAVNDVVEDTKSGNWGVVTAVNGSMLTVLSSKKTFAETGLLEMEFPASDAAHLV